MQKSLFALAAVLALSACAPGGRMMNETTQAITVISEAGAVCTGTREGVQLFAVDAAQAATVTKSKLPIVIECRHGQRLGRVTIESSLDSLSMSPLWDYASGALNRYPSTVAVALGR